MSAQKYLQELQKRILIIILVFVITFIVSVAYSKQIFIFFLANFIPANASLVTLNPYENISIFLNFAFFSAITLTLPVIVYNLIAFISPGLTKYEKKVITFLPAVAFILFLLGSGFNFYITKEYIIPFLSALTLDVGIQNTWSIGYFINFILYTSLIMGLIFQFPLVILTLVKVGLLKVDHVSQFRKQIYISLLVLSAFVTPPDFFSMFIVAVPLIFIFEVTILIGRLMKGKSK